MIEECSRGYRVCVWPILETLHPEISAGIPISPFRSCSERWGGHPLIDHNSSHDQDEQDRTRSQQAHIGCKAIYFQHEIMLLFFQVSFRFSQKKLIIFMHDESATVDQ